LPYLVKVYTKATAVDIYKKKIYKSVVYIIHIYTKYINIPQIHYFFDTDMSKNMSCK
jgi:hypothetical protein